MIEKFHFFLISLFGLGKISRFPGSLGSLATCLLFYLIVTFIPTFFITFKFALFIVLIILFFVSLYSIERYTRFSHHKDQREIIIDEFFGQLIPLIFFYYYIFSSFADKFPLVMKFDFYIILSFFVFRFFDIVKPFPIGWIDKRINNSLGVMFDDLVAGLFTAILLLLPSFLF